MFHNLLNPTFTLPKLNLLNPAWFGEVGFGLSLRYANLRRSTLSHLASCCPAAALPIHSIFGEKGESSFVFSFWVVWVEGTVHGHDGKRIWGYCSLTNVHHWYGILSYLIGKDSSPKVASTYCHCPWLLITVFWGVYWMSVSIWLLDLAACYFASDAKRHRQGVKNGLSSQMKSARNVLKQFDSYNWYTAVIYTAVTVCFCSLHFPSLFWKFTKID